ncbi:MAG TPA: ABC transporter permease [Acidimicrobiia bacterium]|nr:ABC transporter permease [Acidimicrobiia bacterium]
MFAHYIAVALRNIRSAPFAALVNLLTLAIGLLCFVTAYAFVTFWASAERQFRNVDDIHVLTVSIKTRDTGFGFVNATDTPDIAAETLKSDFPAITKIARAVVIDRKTMVAAGDRAIRLFGVAVDPDFLEIFDLPFVAGDARSALAAPRSVVITRESAAKLFGPADPIGKSVLISNAIDATVTGVIDAISEPSHMGRSANAVLPFDLLASRDVLDALSANGGSFSVGTFARGAGTEWFRISALTYLYLPPAGGLSADALAAQLQDFATRHIPAQMLKNQDYSFGLVPVGKVLAGTRDFFDTGLSFETVLLLLGGLVLGVACVNYANLATARAARRVREIGVRKAIGASPVQIAWQSLLEAAALVVAALLVAVTVFVLAQPLVKQLLGAEVGTIFFSSLQVWPALAALVFVVTLAAGAYPALVLSRVRPVSAIATGRARLGSALFSTLLVGTQFGVASFLLIAVTVISMQNAQMRRTALSALEDPLVVIENPANITKVAAATLRERLAAVPQVRAVTEIMVTPWEMLMMTMVKDSPDPTAAQRPATTRPVGFDFFDVFNVPLIAGRVFDREHAEDVHQRPVGAPLGPQVAGPAPGQTPADPPPPMNIVVDRRLVESLGLGTPEEAVGKLVYRPASALPGAQPPPPMRIIGVVEERSFSFFKTPNNTAGTIYDAQSDLGVTVARVTAADVDGALKGIDSEWKQLAPSVAISRRFLDEIFERAFANYVRINQLFGALAVMAFAICIAGLFGMAMFVAGRRRHEIGVRKTLGASTTRMIALLLTRFSRPVLIANLVAWPAGYFAARAYLNQFSGSIPLTPWPFVLSLAITLAIAWLAVVGQTLRAARTTPAEVLRNE